MVVVHAASLWIPESGRAKSSSSSSNANPKATLKPKENASVEKVPPWKEWKVARKDADVTRGKRGTFDKNQRQTYEKGVAYLATVDDEMWKTLSGVCGDEEVNTCDPTCFHAQVPRHISRSRCL